MIHKMQSLIIFLWLFYYIHSIDQQNYDTEKQLERIEDIANSKTGIRKLSFGTVNVERIECNINITSLTQPCSAVKVLEDLFPNLDLEKLTGGFMSFDSMLINIKIEFAKSGLVCNSSEGSIEVNINSTGYHVHVVDKKYLPLKIVFLQTVWDLSVKQLKTVDIEVNGVLLSNTLGINSNIPNYEGVIIEVQKPKGLTIFEFKTVNFPTAELTYLLKDFYIDMSSITIGLALKTKSELSLQTLKFYNATLVGYLEPNIMFEFQLSGIHKGSNAYSSANSVYVTVQKYHGALEPTVAIFGKFDNNVINTLSKVSFVDKLPPFTFLKAVKEHALVLSSEKVSIVNIKEVREASDNFYCKQCRAKFLPGLNIVFRVEDIKSSNIVLNPSELKVGENSVKRDQKEIKHFHSNSDWQRPTKSFADLQFSKKNHIPQKLNSLLLKKSYKKHLIRHNRIKHHHKSYNISLNRIKREIKYEKINKNEAKVKKKANLLKRAYITDGSSISHGDINGNIRKSYFKTINDEHHKMNYYKRDGLKDLLSSASSIPIIMANDNDEDDTLDSTIVPSDYKSGNIGSNLISSLAETKNDSTNSSISINQTQHFVKDIKNSSDVNISAPYDYIFSKNNTSTINNFLTINSTVIPVKSSSKLDNDSKNENFFRKPLGSFLNGDILTLLNENPSPTIFNLEKNGANDNKPKNEYAFNDSMLTKLMQNGVQVKGKKNKKIITEEKTLKKDMLPSKHNESQLMMFANVNKESLVFEMPQKSENDVMSILRFIDPALLNNITCQPFYGSNAKFSFNKLILTEEMFVISMNLTADTEIVPDIFSIKKSFCVSVQHTNGGKVSVSGSGKGKITDTEVKVSLFLDENRGCSVVGTLYWPTLENISEKFAVNLFPHNFKFPNLQKLQLKYLTFSTILSGENFLRLNGEIFTQNQQSIKLETFIWANKSSQNNEIAWALTTKNYNLNDLLTCIYEYKTIVPEWMAVTRAGVVLKPSAKSAFVFEDPLFSQVSMDLGVSFVGVLAKASFCETEAATNAFCQYINYRIPNIAGTIVSGLLKEDSFLLRSIPGSIINFSEDLYMLDPVFSLSYVDGKQDFIISGVVVLNIVGKDVKVKGKISEHASGFPVLEISTLSTSEFFQSSLVTFKPILGSIMLGVSLDFRPVIELLGSHISIGTSEQPIKTINTIGQIALFNQEENFFCGDVKDLSFAKILHAFSLQSKLNELPVIKDANFIGVTKVVYHEGKKERKLNCLEEIVSPGLSIIGQLRISANVIFGAVVRFNETATSLSMQWKKKVFSKGLIQFRKAEDNYIDGPTLISWIWRNTKQVSKTSFVCYVVAIGMEKKNVEVEVERKLDGFLYFTFTLKGLLYSELDMIMEYKGSEREDDDFKVSGRVLDIRKTKNLIAGQLADTFQRFKLLFENHAKQSEDMFKNISMLAESLETSLQHNTSGILRDLVIKLKDCEKKKKEYIQLIEDDCADRCSKKLIEIPIITQQDFSSSDIGNLQIQILTPKWAVNVSCVAACEVEKGIAFKKSQELLISARTLYPQYEKQKLLEQKFEKFLNIAQSIKDIAENAKNQFEKDSLKASKLIKKHEENGFHTDWFEIYDINLPEIAVSTLKGKLPCLKFKLRFSLYKDIRELTESICLNGELFENIASTIFEILFSKSDMRSYFQSFDKFKMSCARLMRHRDDLIKLVQDENKHDVVQLLDEEVFSAANKSRRNSISVLQNISHQTKEKDLYENDFKELIMTVLPQYFVHSYKTSLVMSQKSPWALLKNTKLNPSGTSSEHQNITFPQDNECVTYNSVVSRFAHLTDLLADLVEAYEDGKSTYTATRDNLVDSLHTLDSRITNEANRTYYTKGQLKDMIYWSVRVWKGVEDWVQDSNRQFEDHNRNAVALLTDQLDIAYGTEKVATAADFIDYLSQVARNALKKIEIENSLTVTKRNLRLKQEDRIQSIAITLAAFLRNKDISLDEAATRLPSLKSEIRELLSKVPQCDSPP